MIKRGKRGQMKMSFGMIFSIILIIIFISFAFYAIMKFLDLQNSAQVAKFSRDLQEDVDRAWRGSQSLQKYDYPVPSKVEYVCFMAYGEPESGRYNDFYYELGRAYSGSENMFFYPPGSGQGRDSVIVKNIDLSETTSTENPLCFENVKGKVSLTIKKDFGDALVTITR